MLSWPHYIWSPQWVSWQEMHDEACHLMAARNEGEEKSKSQFLTIPFKGTFPYEWRLATRPHPSKVPPHAPSAWSWGPSLYHVALWETLFQSIAFMYFVCTLHRYPIWLIVITPIVVTHIINFVLISWVWFWSSCYLIIFTFPLCNP